jgi:putative Ca2+/H+ antiporter (TMEM165/GDT1 family)
MSGEVAIPEDNAERFEDSLEREHRAERDLFKALVKSILVSLPIMVGIFVLISAIAISDKTEWYVWVPLGVGLGVIGAFLLGALAGATLNAHKLDDVDRITAGLPPDSH